MDRIQAGDTFNHLPARIAINKKDMNDASLSIQDSVKLGTLNRTPGLMDAFKNSSTILQKLGISASEVKGNKALEPVHIPGTPLVSTPFELAFNARITNLELAAAGLGPLAPSISTLANEQAKSSTGPAPFQFAKNYTIEEIMNDPAKAAAFEKEYLMQESEYFAIARHPKSAMSFDGWALDINTGKATEPRNWSAASKECLDMAILIKALTGDPKAAMVVAKGDVEAAKKQAADILDKKMATYNTFLKEHPDYKGFLPWFTSGEKIEPSWGGSVPGLDVGEWLWTLVVAEDVLRKEGHMEIADKYAKYVDLMRDNVVKVFYDEKAGKVRSNVKMEGTDDYSQAGHLTGEHGVHEGQMMLLFVALLGKNIPDDAADRIFSDVHMNRVEHKYGTTWEGFWGSAHESWAYLFLPYRDMQEYRDLFRIREEIRTQNSAERGYPGFGTSINKPGEPGYVDGTGIEGVGSQPVPNQNLFAVYGSFPLLQQCGDPQEKSGNYGLAWLLNTLQAPKMQGPLGGGESCTNDGKAISPLKTIDGSFPNVIAMFGGITGETADVLKKYGKYDKFINIMKKEYQETFGAEPLKEPYSFALPSTKVPTGFVPEYTSENKKSKDK